MDISKERYRVGDLSEGDFLKIKLQLLQFQSDLSAAKLAKLQSLAALRQLLGFESVPDDYDVQGTLDYQPVHADMTGMKSLAALNRPDLRAAQQAVVAAESQLALQKANGKMDVTGTFNYTHTAGVNTGAFFYNMPLPIFNRNQGEIATSQLRDYAGAATGQRNHSTGFHRRGASVRKSAHQRSNRPTVPGRIRRPSQGIPRHQ